MNYLTQSVFNFY